MTEQFQHICIYFKTSISSVHLDPFSNFFSGKQCFDRALADIHKLLHSGAEHVAPKPRLAAREISQRLLCCRALRA